VKPSAALAPADFAAEKARIDALFGIDATPEDVISSLLYPKVCVHACMLAAINGCDSCV
jgi:pyruvate carboxylase